MPSDFYETQRATSDYLLFHYGQPHEILPHAFGPADALDYPVRCISECLDFAELPSRTHALDLGCSVGRSTFELARHFEHVIGIDYSHTFIDAANQLRTHGELPFSYIEEGDVVKNTTAIVDPAIERSRATFEQGDAHQLRDDLPAFDAILAANLIDRLHRPAEFLQKIHQLLKPGGQLILTSPYTWQETSTPKENWLGGTPEHPHTLDTLKQILTPHFALTATRDLPFLIREHARKYQWSVAQATTWQRLEDV